MPGTTRRAGSFYNLQQLCAAKGIVCEYKNSRVIEMTTPCGGTTAECGTIREAFDTLYGDDTFSELPIQQRFLKPAPKTNDELRAMFATWNRRADGLPSDAEIAAIRADLTTE